MVNINPSTPVAPVVPAAGYIGGKRKLAAQICQHIQATPHRTYCEGFVGMGGIFLRRSSKPPAEVINDRSGDVANFFRILQRHYPQFLDMLRFQISSRREFERLKDSNPSTLTDLERAGRFLYLQRLAYGGKVEGRNFGIDPRSGGGFNLIRLAPLLDDIHDRLAGVIIENLDWLEFINRYDRPETLFYLDPPYWGSEHYYGKTLFAREQFAVMAERLGSIKGRFILSINDTAEIRALFGGFSFIEVSLRYAVSSTASAPTKELIISGP